MESHVPKIQVGPWTNEKHVRFLNSMEASFVRNMLGRNGRHLRLDRYLPDSSESTLDLKSQAKKSHATTSGPRTRMEKTSRRLSSQHQDPSQDQVVPELEKRGGDKDEIVPTNEVVLSTVPTN